MIDGTLIGQNTAEFMESLEASYVDDDSAVVVEVLTIAVIRSETKPDTPEWEDQAVSEDGYSFVHYRASEPSWHRQLGLLEAAKAAILP